LSTVCEDKFWGVGDALGGAKLRIGKYSVMKQELGTLPACLHTILSTEAVQNSAVRSRFSDFIHLPFFVAAINFPYETIT
jgi:hypothetical protein